MKNARWLLVLGLLAGCAGKDPPRAQLHDGGGGGGADARAETPDAGRDGGCTPCEPALLLGIDVAEATLQPAFDPAVRDYEVRVPLRTDSITLTVTAPEHTQVSAIGDGDATALPITSGEPVTLSLAGSHTWTLSAVRTDSAGRDDLAAKYLLTVQRGENVYIKASNPGEDDGFGSNLALSGETLVVGAPSEASSARGVNGNQASDAAPYSGAAYVFTRAEHAWTQQAYLKASNTGENDAFGGAVAIDADTLVVGARGEASAASGVNGDASDDSLDSAGAAYVFVRQGGAWRQQAYLKASNPGKTDSFGASVAISGDTIVVGAPSEASGAKGVNGDQADDSAMGAGAAYVFTRANGKWAQQAYLKSSDTAEQQFFGMRVAILGDTIAVSAARIFGSTGAIHLFARKGSTWTETAVIRAPDAFPTGFGTALALGANTLVVGAPDDMFPVGTPAENAALGGVAYVYTRNGSDAKWTRSAELRASDGKGGDELGCAVALSGETLLVGAYKEGSHSRGLDAVQSNTTGNSGAAYLFERKAGSATWTQAHFIKGLESYAEDRFGLALAASPEHFAIGAPGENGGDPGVGGSPINYTVPNSGAVFVY
ncbi:MAG TPA: cadherin-like beta sandwich domain-containing protein [Polyangiales bacterium]|nr:cadherin-like beta sandwich domain-containing protein [Polyangiales bacterium]